MEAGRLATPVAHQLGRSDCVVRRCWDQWIREMSFTRRPVALQPQVAPSLGANVSSRTIRSNLAKGHLGSWCPIRVQPLTLTHRRLLLEWCGARGNWTPVEWNQVVLSDECRFNLSSNDNRVHVWKPVLNASILPFLYSDTPPSQVV
ncbi:transposable element Tcb2 transposase [Trichonephila clavipes]|nr:transposable element Tcb2 transposase [Trichonephila clavipes]